MKKKINNLSLIIIDFLNKLGEEGKKTSEASIILARYAKGDKVSKEDMDKFRNQIVNVVKMLGLGAFIIVPGSSILLPLIIKIAKKYNINILPSSFNK